MKTAKLFILMAALICATTAWAQTKVSTDDELRTAIQTDGANITVTADIDLSNSTLSIESGMTVTIDLGGHTLDRKLTMRGEGGGQVITVREGATLNLSNGTLKGGWGGAGGALVNEGGTVTLTSVTCSNNVADDRGGGICNREGGTLTMTNCSITNNHSNDKSGAKGGGGFFNEEGATATLTNVTITGNDAKVCGGGGICNFGTLTIDGCTITGNIAGTNGGGIWQEGTLNVQGKHTITDNQDAGGKANNVYLKNGKVITVTGSLAGSNVGLNMESGTGTFTSGYNTYNSGTDPATIFKDDLNGVMAVSLDDKNEAQLSNALPEGDIYYIERSWDEENKAVRAEVKIMHKGEYTLFSNKDYDDDLTLSGGTYVVKGNVFVDGFVRIKGDTKLILCDGATMKIDRSVVVSTGRDFNVYGQTKDSGLLKNGDNTFGDHYYAGIGTADGTGTTFNFHGGTVEVESDGGYAAGIGLHWSHDGENGSNIIPTINIYGGNIKAIGHRTSEDDPRGGGKQYGSSGIGSWLDEPEGVITIYGGDVYAKGDCGAGIGIANYDSRYKGDYLIVINGGHIIAKGEGGSAGIGGSYETSGKKVIINGGHVEAYGGTAGIGSGYKDGYNAGNLTINGGYVYAQGGDDSAGIGGGDGSYGQTVTINGGEVHAIGGDDGAGIGGGWGASGGNLTVNGGIVIARGGGNGAGIGCGSVKISRGGVDGGTFTMTGGHVYAYGGVDAAGIGGGEDGDGGTINISGGYVYAEGNDYGSGIGGGQGGYGANVTITGGVVIAKAGANAPRAIGAGDEYDVNGSLTLGDDRCVYITTNLWRCKKENRVSDCFGAAYLQISECLHGGATASVVNGDKHSIADCKWCYVTGEDTHTFRDYGECDACHLIRLEDEGNNSALFSKWNDGDVHDFLLSGRELIPHEDGSSRAYTVCLPFDMDLSDRRDDLMVYTLSYIKDGSEMVFTQSAKKIEAGKPYLIVIHKGELELLGHSKLITTASEGVRVYDWANREQPLGWWRGTLTKIESADAAAMMAYALQSVGDFRRIRPDTYWAWWGAFRSMYCPDVLPATNKFTINKATFDGFGGQTVTVTFEGDAEIPDETTGIRSIDNSQLTIDNWAGAWYNLQGRRVANGQKPKAKGLYINNGRKTVIK